MARELIINVSSVVISPFSTTNAAFMAQGALRRGLADKWRNERASMLLWEIKDLILILSVSLLRAMKAVKPALPERTISVNTVCDEEKWLDTIFSGEVQREAFHCYVELRDGEQRQKVLKSAPADSLEPALHNMLIRTEAVFHEELWDLHLETPSDPSEGDGWNNNYVTNIAWPRFGNWLDDDSDDLFDK